MNIKQGLMRAWIAGSSIWVAGAFTMSALIAWDNPSLLDLQCVLSMIGWTCGPPLVAGALGRISWWIGLGFKR